MMTGMMPALVSRDPLTTIAVENFSAGKCEKCFLAYQHPKNYPQNTFTFIVAWAEG